MYYVLPNYGSYIVKRGGKVAILYEIVGRMDGQMYEIQEQSGGGCVGIQARSRSFGMGNDYTRWSDGEAAKMWRTRLFVGCVEERWFGWLHKGMEQPRCGVRALAGMVNCVSGQLSKRVAKLPLR